MAQINFCNALNKTMSEYGITSAWICKKSGVSDQAMSTFRNGKTELRSKTLEKIIGVLPEDAREYFFAQLSPSDKTLEALILRASDEEKAKVLRIIAASLSKGVLVDVA